MALFVHQIYFNNEQPEPTDIDISLRSGYDIMMVKGFKFLSEYFKFKKDVFKYREKKRNNLYI